MEHVVTTDGGGKYYIVEFDAGAYRKASVRSVLDILRSELNPDNAYTDVVLIAHGWTEFRDPENGYSIDLPNRLVPALENAKPCGVKPLYIAISWAAVPDIKLLPQYAAAELRRLFDEFRGNFKFGNGGTTSAITSRSIPNVSTTLEQAVDDVEQEIALFVQDNSTDDSIPEILSHKLVALAKELRMNENEDDDYSCLLEVNHQNGVPSSEQMQQMYRNTKNADEGTDVSVATRSWKREDRTLPKIYKLAQLMHTLRFGQFERRASKTGSNGVHALIAEVMEMAEMSVRFSAFGHSLGAHMVQGGAIGNGKSQFNRKMQTLFLAQGACNKDGLGRGGTYRPLVSQLRPVAGPIVATTSDHDKTLVGYKVTGFVGLGGGEPIGLLGFGEHEPFEHEVKVIDDIDDGLALFRKDTCFTLDGTKNQVISDHGDIDNQKVVALFWQAVTTPLNADDYKPTDPELLPSKYWKDSDLRTEKLW